MMRRAAAVVLVLALAIPVVLAHSERPAEFPEGDGLIPQYRPDGPYLVTCKPESVGLLAAHPFAAKARTLALAGECRLRGFEHLQAAVDAVPAAGYRILMLPGTYQEEPSVARAKNPSPECAPLKDTRVLTYEEHNACPNTQNLVAILGDDPADEDARCRHERLCRLQIEGLGLTPNETVLDANWTVLNGLRGDRADGLYLYNFLGQRTDFNALYVLETDGFVFDRMVGRWNYEYGFLSFAVDHGLYKDCEAYGNGDSGVYPGSASDLHGARPSVEITRCDSHHNTLGYSGTAGNSVYAHDNDFHHNVAGIATDSLFPDHPGLPQDSARFVNNRIWSNNENYYDNWLPDGPCFKPLAERGIELGIVCPVVPLPVGTGIIIAGGNSNRIAGNWIWDNWRYGTMLFGVPAVFRGEDGGVDALCLIGSQDPNCLQPDPEDAAGDAMVQFDTSHDNWYLDNQMGLTPDGAEMPNGMDHWWDEGGSGNCWLGNVYGAEGPRGSEPDPMFLPVCGQGVNAWHPPNPRLATIVPCNDFSVPENPHPTGCPWMDDPSPP
ncbi:MAG: right-handed parallel beta-helix repeat-containing protein [Thermoplasmatota archaeon]